MKGIVGLTAVYCLRQMNILRVLIPYVFSMFSDSVVADICDHMCQKINKEAQSILIGLAGAQGSGKSTLAQQLQAHLQKRNVESVVLSIDDFYLLRSERANLATLVHPLYTTRGVPGTHDVQLLRSVIENILFSRVTRSVTWPKFDKAIDDRLVNVTNGAALGANPYRCVLILEGWCVGCGPLDDINIPVNELERLEDAGTIWRRHIDACIRSEYIQLWKTISYYIFVKVPSKECIRIWRMQQAVQNGEDLKLLQMDRFLQFFERISQQMLRPEGRIKTDAVVELANDHSVCFLNLTR
jgi:D-glycerate 3-kinase